VIETGTPIIDKIELVRNAGNSLDWFNTTKVPVLDRDNRVIGLAGITRDISKMNLANERFLYWAPVIETIIMLQTDTSVRNGEEADVTITPRFARSSWRDIHLARAFEEAGRVAALEQLDRLKALAGPSR